MVFNAESWEASINEAAILLRADGLDFWSDKLVKSINSPSYVQTFFGGMGSLNDLILSDEKDNDRFHRLLKMIYKLSSQSD